MPMKFTSIPKKVSQKDFNAHILPHLKRPHKGPDPKISLYKIFNYVLYVLHTGCQWNKLPVYRNEIHWSNIYKWHRRWSEDGSYEQLFLASVTNLNEYGKLDLKILHVDGSNTVAKKGATA